MFAWVLAISQLLQFWITLESRFRKKHKHFAKVNNWMTVTFVVLTIGLLAAAVSSRIDTRMLGMLDVGIMGVYFLALGAAFVYYGRSLVKTLESTGISTVNSSGRSNGRNAQTKRISRLTYGVGGMLLTLVAVLACAYPLGPSYPNRTYILSLFAFVRAIESLGGAFMIHALGTVAQTGTSSQGGSKFTNTQNTVCTSDTPTPRGTRKGSTLSMHGARSPSSGSRGSVVQMNEMASPRSSAFGPASPVATPKAKSTSPTIDTRRPRKISNQVAASGCLQQGHNKNLSLVRVCRAIM